MAERSLIYPVLPGNCPDAGYKLVSKKGFIEAPLSSENLEWTKDTAITEADKQQIITNKNDIADLKEDVANIETEIADKSEVSGENDGTNWTSLTIDGTTKAIPSGGGGGGFTPTQAQLDAMNSGIDSTKVGQIETNADDIDNINDTIADIQSDLADKVDKVAGKGLSTNDYTDADKAKVAEIDNKSVVSGTNDGTNWTSLTINGTTKAIPSGGSGGFEPTSAQLTAMNSGIDSTKVAQIQTNANNIAGKQAQLSTAQLNACNSGIDSTKVAQIATNTTDIANKVDKVTGKGLSTNDYTTADQTKVGYIGNGVETLTFTLADSSTVTLKVVKGA